MRCLIPLCALSMLCVSFGCGKKAAPAGGATADGAQPALSQSAGSGNAAAGGQAAGNHSRYAGDIQETARLLGAMSQEYESLANSGQSTIEIKQTPKLNEELDQVASRITSLGAPAEADARQLKAGSLPQLAEAIKSAELAETHLRQRYRVLFSFNRGSEIDKGIATGKRVFSWLQQNLPQSERLTLGVPPAVGGRPPANVSFGDLTAMGVEPVQYQPFGSGAAREVVAWRVEADPAAPGQILPPDARLGIEIPHLTTQRSFRSQPVQVLYPATPSVHVAVGMNQMTSQSRHVWDLALRKRLGTIKGLQLQSSNRLALSPDGKYFAGSPERTNVVGIWDVAAARAVKTVTLTVTGEQSLLEFAADNRIVVVVDKTLYVLSTPSGEVEHQVDLSRTVPTSPFYFGYAWALSPGGRYLAIADPTGKDVLFVDVTSGETAGRLDVTTETFVRWIAVDFSDDGERMAILLDGSFNSWIQVWDVAQGRIVSTFKFDNPLSKLAEGERDYQGPSVDWFPDGRRLLVYGRGIFDTESGELVLLPSATLYRLRPLGGDQLAIVEKTKLAPYDLNQSLSAPLKAAREEQAPDDAQQAAGRSKLPPLQPADRSQVVFQNNDGDAAWMVEADPGPAPAVGDVKIGGLSSGPALVHAAVAADGKRAAVGYASKRLSLQRGSILFLDGVKTWVEHCALTAGASPQRLDFPFPAALQALSPSGSTICTKSLEALGRLDFWSTATGRREFGFRPYEQATAGDGIAVIWADFVDDQTLLTLAPGRLTLWQLPECRAVWEMQINTAARPVFSPGRRYLAVGGELAGECTIVECADGTIAGKVRLPEQAGTIAAVGFAREDNRLAIVSSEGTAGRVTMVNGASGQIESTFPIPLAGGIVQWCGADHLLIDGAYLVNVPQQACAWLYQLGSGTHVADSPDGRHWYLAGGARTGERLTLTAAHVPDAAASAAISKGTLQTELVLRPGGRIGLDIQVMDPPGQAGFGQQVYAKFQERFAAAGTTVDPSAPIKLVVRGKSEKTGRGLSIGVDEEEVVWTVSVERGQEILWRQTRRATNSGVVLVDRQASAEESKRQAAQKMTEQMWKNASNYLLNFALPTYVFGPGAGEGLGSSKLTEGGAEAEEAAR